MIRTSHKYDKVLYSDMINNKRKWPRSGTHNHTIFKFLSITRGYFYSKSGLTIKDKILIINKSLW